MKIVVIHGDDVIKSRARLEKFIDVARKRGWEIIRTGNASSNIQEDLSSPTLFGTGALFLVENTKFLTKNQLSWIKTNSPKLTGNLVIYSENCLTKTLLANLPKDAEIEEYRLPKIIFKFLESFYPGNTQVCINLLHELSLYQPVEFIFALLARYVRDLYWVVEDPTTLNYPDWRLGKLKGQATRFKNLDLGRIINGLAKIDIDAKTSKADLLSSLDLLIVTKLK